MVHKICCKEHHKYDKKTDDKLIFAWLWFQILEMLDLPKIKEEKMSRIREILLWMTIVFLFFSLCGTFAFAKGKGMGQGSSGQKGWSQGEKTGWQTDAPPGYDKEKQGQGSSGLGEEKKIQEKNKDDEKRKEGEPEKVRERERHRERVHEGESRGK